ncbi:MAG: aminotransferase class I/II-fold pyridoxal phosphate-dependent enzyme [Lachnospiraceae bacterium]|nr:aminotransferase class I/II-fold pyridoxal phosphate-dependent enzyme [Lachnospiraceae bacterium]
MNTPIFDFVKAYSEKENHRLHMPGHKGQTLLGPEGLDITEIKGADSLYEAASVIAESEKNAAELFGSGRTFYSTEGSSQCIKAMLYLVTQGRTEGKRPVIIAARNAHRAFLSGAALLDIDICWLWPEGDESSLCSGDYSAEALENKINSVKQAGKNLCGVYVTSPDYLGKMLPLKEFSKICRGYDIPLMVDNAHGAYLHFLDTPKHPMDYYIDMCCDSAHKTLSALTGGAYLHISSTAAEKYQTNAKAAMLLFGSTSPSYLTLCSLDLCNKELDGDFSERLEKCCEETERTKKMLEAEGYVIYGDEPCKLTIDLRASGLDSEKIAEGLRKKHIEPEYVDRDYIVFMFSAYSNKKDYTALADALTKLKNKCKADTEAEQEASKAFFVNVHPTQEVSLKEAITSEFEIIKTEDSEGRIVSQPDFSCPPAVCICAPGERINREAKVLMEYYNHENVCVIKEKPSAIRKNTSELIAYVDGSFDASANKYSYGCVLLVETDKGNEEVVTKLSGSGEDPDVAKIRNVAGEMLGAMNAIKWAKSNGYHSVDIRYDYMGIEMWATGKWKANNEYTKSYARYMKQASRDIEIKYKKIAAHTGNTYNEMADKLAKGAL